MLFVFCFVLFCFVLFFQNGSRAFGIDVSQCISGNIMLHIVAMLNFAEICPSAQMYYIIYVDTRLCLPLMI